jgi:hypothetical protein
MSKKQNSDSTDLKVILQSLKRIEKKINECCPSCIDFTTKKPRKQTKQYVEKLGSHELRFDAPRIEIKSNPPGKGNGLNIPGKLNIFISPPCRRVTVTISKFDAGGLAVMHPDINNQLMTSETPTTELDNHQFDFSGHIDRLHFHTASQKADVKKVCCYP